MILKSLSTKKADNGSNIFTNKAGGKYVMILATFGDDLTVRSMYIGLDQQWGKKNLETVKTWKVGQEVPVILEDNGDYKNFKIAGKTDLLEQRVKALEGKVFGVSSAQPQNPQDNDISIPPLPVEQPEEVKTGEIPF
jgi:hypothetical protein